MKKIIDDLNLLLEWAFPVIATVGTIVVILASFHFSFERVKEKSNQRELTYENKIEEIGSEDFSFSLGTGIWQDADGQEYTLVALGPDEENSEKEVYILNSSQGLEYRTYEDGKVVSFEKHE